MKIKKSDIKAIIKEVIEEKQLNESPSGKVKIKKEKYSWGIFRLIEVGMDFSIPIHPEHWNKIEKDVINIEGGGTTKFKDETRTVWTVSARPSSGIRFKSNTGVVNITADQVERLK